MRQMTVKEIEKLLVDVTWGTICGVLPDGTPYATEVTYLYENNEIISLSHSKGMTGDCVRHCSQICFKVCESNRMSRNFRAISLFGEATFEEPDNADESLLWWEKLETRLKSPDRYQRPKLRCQTEGKIYPVFHLNIQSRTGVTDWNHAND